LIAVLITYFISISDSTVTKLDFDLEPEPPPAPPRAASLGEVDESSEVRALDTPGQARQSKPCIIPFYQMS
jgi:protein kinase N